MQRIAYLSFALATLAACEVAPPIARPQQTMPEAAAVTIDAPPAVPVPPLQPEQPEFVTPKRAGADWRAVWNGDFTNDSQPASLPKDLGPIGVVMPTGAEESARLGLVSGLLAIPFATADYGQFQSSHIAVNESTPSEDAHLGLDDAIARWARSSATQNPPVKSLFVVRTCEYEAGHRDVAAFDPALPGTLLADYNAKATAYNADRAAYVAARKTYEAEHAAYLKRHAQWRTAMAERIAVAKRAHDAESAAAARAHEQKHADPTLAQRPAPPQPEPFHTPALAEPVGLAMAIDLLDAPLLSPDVVRELLARSASVSVEVTTLRLGGQFVDTKTGMSVATIDAKLVLPAEAGKSEAAMLRELLQRLAR